MTLRDIIGKIVPAAQAHEKWFLPAERKAYAVPDYYYSLNPLTAASLLAAAASVAVGIWLDRIFERSLFYKKTESKLLPLRDIAPRVLAVTTGILLLWNAYHNSLLEPNFPLVGSALGPLLRWTEVLVGFLLILGLYTRQAALALVGFIVVLFPLHPAAFPDQIEVMYLIGVAVFLFHFAGDRFSFDRALGRGLPVTQHARHGAYLTLRLLLGITLIDLALTNKWLNPGAHFALMDAFPDLNPYVLLQWSGFTWLTREAYVFMIALTELIIGIYVTAGFLTRIAALLLIPLFIVSVAFLPIGELLGHFPVIGTLFVLFVFGDTYHKHITSRVRR